eukprot:2979539-Rhodomonas_salina.1
MPVQQSSTTSSTALEFLSLADASIPAPHSWMPGTTDEHPRHHPPGLLAHCHTLQRGAPHCDRPPA